MSDLTAFLSLDYGFKDSASQFECLFVSSPMVFPFFFFKSVLVDCFRTVI